MARDYDAIVIGTGQSGPALAHRLSAAGRKVAVIERRRFGGTCVNTGCTPTKSLIASARAAHVARRGADFGVVIDAPVRVDMQAVKARKDAIVRVSNEGVDVAHARFVGPKRVEVNGEILEAEQIFVNVGARAAIPPIHGDRERAHAVFSLRAFSNLLGVVELATAAVLGLAPFAPRLGALGGRWPQQPSRRPRPS